MSGHSKWKQIKHKKGLVDKKRSQLFSKLLSVVSTAARKEPNPKLNPELKTAIERAREANVPLENIKRALSRVSSYGDLEEFVAEAYGPGGVAVLVFAETSSKNRTAQEIKLLLKNLDGKWADPGSVRWMFEQKGDAWEPRFPQEFPPDDLIKLNILITALEKLSDVVVVYTNIIHT